MIHPFFHGLLFGLIFLLFIGPAFFALLQTSIQQGLKPAIFLALGISASDACFVLLTLFGISPLLQDPSMKLWLGLPGSIILIAYGIYTWFKKAPAMQDPEEQTGKYLIKYWIKGLFLNGLNPFIILFWLSWVSFVSVNYDYGPVGQRYFFAGVLLTILVSDIVKATIANKKKHLINPKHFRVINKAVALVLVAFGLRIVYFLISNYL